MLPDNTPLPPGSKHAHKINVQPAQGFYTARAEHSRISPKLRMEVHKNVNFVYIYVDKFDDTVYIYVD